MFYFNQNTLYKGGVKMKKGIITILLISLAMILIVSLVSGQITKPSGPTSDPIKIGGSLSLTGMYSETAKWVKLGYDYWVEDINKRGDSWAAL